MKVRDILYNQLLSQARLCEDSEDDLEDKVLGDEAAVTPDLEIEDDLLEELQSHPVGLHHKLECVALDIIEADCRSHFDDGFGDVFQESEDPEELGFG